MIGSHRRYSCVPLALAGAGVATICSALVTGGERPPSRILTATPEAILGARLFRETRFAQYFAEHSGGNPNAVLENGDPVMNEVVTTSGRSLPALYSGSGINCRQCHLGDDYLPARRLMARTYCDFSRRSPIPDRRDGHATTVRNSPLMIDLETFRETQPLFHFDGEFASLEDLIADTLTGRNFGWLPTELRSRLCSHSPSGVSSPSSEDVVACCNPSISFGVSAIFFGSDRGAQSSPAHSRS